MLRRTVSYAGSDTKIATESRKGRCNPFKISSADVYKHVSFQSSINILVV